MRRVPSGRQSVVFVLGVIPVLDLFELTLSGFQFRDVNGGSRLRFRSLPNAILIEGYTPVKIVSQTFIRHDAVFHRVEFVGLDPIK